MNNNSSKIDSIQAGATSAVYDPRYSAVGIGRSNYTIGDWPSTSGDSVLDWKKSVYDLEKNNIYKDYNRSWEYTYTDHVNDIDPDVMRQIQDYINKSNQKPATSTPGTVNTVTTETKPVRKKMAKSKDVGEGLAEMINDLL